MRKSLMIGFGKLIACVSLVSFNFVNIAAGDGPWDAIAQLTSTQGSNGWYYQQRPQGASTPVTNMTYASGQWRTSDYPGGHAGWLGSFMAADGHPGGSLDVIRNWVAPSRGTVSITGSVYKTDTTGGAGIIASVEHNGTLVWSKTLAYNDATGYPTDSALGAVSVNSGDSIAFIVDDNGTYAADSYAWDPVITKIIDSWDAVAQLTSTQGSNGWYYQQRPRTGGSATNMTYSDGQWRTSDYPGGQPGWLGLYLGIDGHPGGSLAVIRNWIAPSGGTFSVTGHVYKVDTTAGAGIVAKVEKQGVLQWCKTLAYNDTTGYTTDSDLSALTVNSGDSIAFIVDDNGTYAADSYAWDPVIKKAYDAVAQLTSTQGSNGWYYQQRPQGATTPVTNMIYSDAQWRTTDYPTGHAGWLGFFSPTDGHPGGSLDVIRHWIAPLGGTFSIAGHVYKTDTSGGAGIVASVEQNGTSIWSKTLAYNDATGYTTDSALGAVAVSSGDSIAFVVDDNGTYAADSYAWDPVITSGSVNASYYAKDQFSSIQGQNQWYYQQRAVGTSTYTNMATYSSGTWQGGSGAFVSDHSFKSDNSYDAVRTWVAPATGTVRIAGVVGVVDLKLAGTYDSSTMMSHCISISVLRNGVLLWFKLLVNDEWLGYDTEDDSQLGAVPVTVGDSIQFVVSKNTSANNAETSWSPHISYITTPTPINKTYYVSASGSDTNTGDTTSTPFLTVKPLNKIHNFGENVHILFRSGDTFAGGLNVCMNGKPGATDEIGRYNGTGTTTLDDLVSSSDTTTNIIQLSNSSYVTVHNLNLIGTLYGSGTYGTTSYVPGNHACGILLYSRSNTGTRHKSIYIDNMVFKYSFSGVFADVEANAPNTTAPDGLDDFQITNSTFDTIYQVGSVLFGFNGGAGGPVGQNTNIYIGNNTFTNIKGYTGYTSDASAVGIYNSTGITIEKNLASYIGGIGPSPTTGRGGSTALGVTNARNFIIQKNEVHDTSSSTAIDGSAIDADQDSCNGEIAYNLTYNNGGPSVESGSYGGLTNSNIVIHHNMSYNDVRGNASAFHWGSITVWGSTDTYQIFNNTLYMDSTGTLSGSTPSAFCFSNTNGTNKHIKVWNNILKTTNGAPMINAVNDNVSNPVHIDSTNQFIANLYDKTGSLTELISTDDTQGNTVNVTSLSAWRLDLQEEISSTPYGVEGMAMLTSLSAPTGYLPTYQVSTFTNFDLTSGSAAIGQAYGNPWPNVTLTTPMTVQTYDFYGATAAIPANIGADTN